MCHGQLTPEFLDLLLLGDYFGKTKRFGLFFFGKSLSGNRLASFPLRKPSLQTKTHPSFFHCRSRIGFKVGLLLWTRMFPPISSGGRKNNTKRHTYFSGGPNHNKNRHTHCLGPEKRQSRRAPRRSAGTRDLAGYDDLRQTFAGRRAWA